MHVYNYNDLPFRIKFINFGLYELFLMTVFMYVEHAGHILIIETRTATVLLF